MSATTIQVMEANNWIALPGRVAWAGTVALLIVFLAYSSTHDTNLNDLGGLSNCFFCLNSWDYHFLFMTVAFAVLMFESVMAFKAPLIPV